MSGSRGVSDDEGLDLGEEDDGVGALEGLHASRMLVTKGRDLDGAMRWRTTSVSEEVLKMELSSSGKGWTLRREEAVSTVEQRTWLMAAKPGRESSFGKCKNGKKIRE